MWPLGPLDANRQYIANRDVVQLVKEARHYVHATILNLEQNYPNWNEAGKAHAVQRAVKDCNEAWRRLEFITTQAKDCFQIVVDKSKGNGV